MPNSRLHSLLIVSLMLASTSVRAQDSVPLPEKEWFAIDQSVRERFDLGAHEVSYDTMYLALAGPLGLLATREDGERRAKYLGGAIVTNLAINYVVKFSVRRPRPYNHNPEAIDYIKQTPTTRYLSFYSGHSSTSFVGGIGGGLMMRDRWSRPLYRDSFWFLQSALASTSAFMRVAAGVHYYSDITVGAMAGTTVALVAANMADVDMDLQPGEYLAIASGLLAGGWLAFNMDFSGALMVTPHQFESGHSGAQISWRFR